jgi:hypothetical protein
MGWDQCGDMDFIQGYVAIVCSRMWYMDWALSVHSCALEVVHSCAYCGDGLLNVVMVCSRA